jgi:carbamoyl-phosphate synthase large subunit
MGIPLSRIHEITRIDMWFLKQYEELFHLEKEISKYSVATLPKELLLEAKQKGYGDRQIAHMMGCLESQVHKLRDEQGIKRVYKLVDTCAAEFKAQTPYYYSTFEAEIEKADGTKYTANESIVSVLFSPGRSTISCCMLFPLAFKVRIAVAFVFFLFFMYVFTRIFLALISG